MINKEARGFLASLFFTNKHTRDKMNESQSLLEVFLMPKQTSGKYEKILQAAIEVISEKGLDKASLMKK